MQYTVPVVLVMVAIIHALPIVGVLGADKLTQLYGVTLDDPKLEVLLRHRAVLFGMLAALLACSAFRPEWHRLGLVVGWVSVVSFLLLAQPTSQLAPGLTNVIRADWIALVLLVAGTTVHWMD